MGQTGDRLRDIETRESADMIEVNGDPNTLNGGTGVTAAPGLMAINPATGLMYYNQDGDPTGWIGFGTSSPVPGGEVNTGANVGTSGGEVYRDKSGVVLNFRKIAGVAPIVGATNVDLVDVSLDLDLVSTVTSANATDLILLRQVGGTYNKITEANLLAGAGGENNTGTNLGTGKAVYAGMGGTVLQFRSLIDTLPIVATQNANDITLSFDISPLSAISPVYGTEELVIEQSTVIGKTTFNALLTGAGGITGASNLGLDGEGVFAQVTSQVIELKKLYSPAGEGLSIYSDSDTIYFKLYIRTLPDAPSSPPPASDYFLGEKVIDGAKYRVPMSELGEDNLVVSATSLGTGSDVYKQLTGTELEFRSLIGANGIATTENANDITFGLDVDSLTTHPSIAGADWLIVEDEVTDVVYKLAVSDILAVGGFATGGTSLGSGLAIYSSTLAGILQFNSILADAPIGVTSTGSSEVKIEIDLNTLSVHPGPGAGDYLLIRDSGGINYKIDFADLEGSITGAANTGASGIGVFDTDNAGTLEFQKLFGDTLSGLIVSQGTGIVEFDLDYSRLTVRAAPVVGTDLLSYYDTSASLVKSIDVTAFISDLSLGTITGATNLGTGADAYKSEVSGVLQFRSFKAFLPVTVLENTDEIEFNFDVGGLTVYPSSAAADLLLIETVAGNLYKVDWDTIAPVIDATSIGTGSDVFRLINARQLWFRSILGGSGIDTTENTDDITLDLDVNGLTTDPSPVGIDWLIIEEGSASFLTYKIAWNTLVPVTVVSNVGAGSTILKGITLRDAELRSLIATAPVTAAQNTNDITFDFEISGLTLAPTPGAGDLFLLRDSGGTNYKVDWSSVVIAPVVTGASSIGTGSDVYKQLSGTTLQFRSLIGTNPITVTQNANDITFDFDISPLTLKGSVAASDMIIVRAAIGGLNYKLNLFDELAGLPFGEDNLAANVGTGVGLYRDKTSVTLNFKTIKGTAPVAIGSAADEITLSLGIISLLDDPGPTTGHYLLIQTGTAYYKLDYADLPVGTITGASNLGAGANAYKSEAAGVLQFRSFTAILPVTVSELTNTIEFNFDIGGLVTAPGPVVGDLLLIETAVGGTLNKITWSDAVPVISATSLGTGADVYRTIDTRSLWFRSLIGGSGISATQNTDDITFDLDVDSLTTDPSPVGIDWLIIEDDVGNVVYKINWNTLVPVVSVSNIGTGSNVFKAITTRDVELRSIIGGSAIDATENTNDITLDINVKGLTTHATPNDADWLILESDLIGVAYKINWISLVPILNVTNVGTGISLRHSLADRSAYMRGILNGEGITPVLSGGDNYDIVFNLDIAGITLSGTPTTTDLIAYYDGTNIRKSTITNLVSGIGAITGGSNLGTGANVFESEVTNVLRFRSLIATNGIVAVENANDITFSLDVDSLTTHPTPAVGDWLILEDDITDVVYKIDWQTLVPITSIASVGLATPILYTLTNREQQFRSLANGEGVSVLLGGGGGFPELEFHLDFAGITLSGTPATTDLIAYYDGSDIRQGTITNLLSGLITGGNQLGLGADVFKSEIANVLQFRSLKSTNGIGYIENTDDISFYLDVDSLTTHPSPAVGDWLILEDTVSDVGYKIDWQSLVPVVSSYNRGIIGHGLYYSVLTRSMGFKKLYANTNQPITITAPAGNDYLEFDFSIAAVATAPATPAGTDLILAEKSSDGSHYKLPLLDILGDQETVVVDKVIWLSALQRYDSGTSPSNGYRSLTSYGIPSNATGVLCRFVYLQQASGLHSYAGIGSGKESNTHQLVLYGYVTSSTAGEGERDAFGLVELDGTGRVYLQTVGSTWNVRIEMYGYVLPVTISGSAISPRGGKWIRTTDTALTTSAFYAVPWETEDRDSDTMWSSGTNVTIKTAGTYVVSFEAAFASNATAYSIQALVEHESVYEGATKIDSAPNEVTRIQATAVLVCAVNDIVKGVVRQTAGSNRNLTEAKMSVDRISG